MKNGGLSVRHCGQRFSGEDSVGKIGWHCYWPPNGRIRTVRAFANLQANSESKLSIQTMTWPIRLVAEFLLDAKCEQHTDEPCESAVRKQRDRERR